MEDCNRTFNENCLPALLKVEELAEILRIGKVKAYELVKTPGFPVIKIGRQVRVPTKPFFDWLNSQKVICVGG